MDECKSLIVDAFLQDREWALELMSALNASCAELLLVGVQCADAELERRERERGDRIVVRLRVSQP